MPDAGVPPVPPAIPRGRGAVGRLMFPALLLILAGLPGCAYYNTFYFAKKYYAQAEILVLKSQSDRMPPDALKKYDDSIKQCNKVLQLHAGSRWMDDAIFLMGACYYGKKEYESALRKFDELQANYPKSKFVPQALFLSGLCHYQRRGFEDMEDSFRKVLEVDPHFGRRDEILYTRAQAVEQGPVKSGAIRLYQQLVREFPRSRRAEEARMRVGDLYFDAGRADSAYTCYVRLMKSARTDKGYQDAVVKAADSQVRMGRTDEAIKALEKLVPHDESNQRLATDEWPVRIRIHLAAAYNAAKKHRQALSLLKTAVERYPASPQAPEAQFEIGYTYEVFLDSLDAARKAYQDMSKYSSQSVFRDQGQVRARNLEQLQSLSTQASGDSASSREAQAEAALKIAEVYLFSQDRTQDALQKYREVLQQFPQTQVAPRAAYAIGWIHLNKTEGSQDSAVVELHRVIRDYPASKQARRAVDLLAGAGADTTGLRSLLAATEPDTVAAAADSTAGTPADSTAASPPGAALAPGAPGSALPGTVPAAAPADSAFLRTFVGPLPPLAPSAAVSPTAPPGTAPPETSPKTAPAETPLPGTPPPGTGQPGTPQPGPPAPDTQPPAPPAAEAPPPVPPDSLAAPKADSTAVPKADSLNAPKEVSPEEKPPEGPPR